MGILCATDWILNLFPAHPKLAPIFNPITHMVDLPFPLLLIFPALAIDLVLHLTRNQQGWWRRIIIALLLGTVFLAVFIPVQWFFSKFLISPRAENWFFMGDRIWGYSNGGGNWHHEFWRSDSDPFTISGHQVQLAFRLREFMGRLILRRLDEKGPAMNSPSKTPETSPNAGTTSPSLIGRKRAWVRAIRCSAFDVRRSMFPCVAPIHAFILFLSLLALTAQAHIGSPDIFFDGMAGPYPVRVTVRMPSVVPGRAEISASVQTADPVEVSFLPIYSNTPITNAPPADVGKLVRGETNLYSGELWLMRFGAYSVEVRVKGTNGDGAVEIPVTSMAIRQLPMPSVLGKILLLLCAVLVIGGIGIAAAAGREAALPSGASTGKWERWKGFFAATATTIIFALALFYGRRWWGSEENAFRYHLREGAWPDLDDVRSHRRQRSHFATRGRQRIFQA